MKRWWLSIALLLSLGVNVGVLLTLALGHRPGPDRHPGPWDQNGPPPEMLRFVDRLGLEGEDRERFVDLQRQFLRTAVEARRRSRELQRELRRELISPQPDRERAEALVDELTAVQRTLETQLVRTVIESRTLLDEEQERRYLHMMGRLRGRLDRLDGRGAGPPGPRRDPGR